MEEEDALDAVEDGHPHGAEHHDEQQDAQQQANALHGAGEQSLSEIPACERVQLLPESPVL